MKGDQSFGECQERDPGEDLPVVPHRCSEAAARSSLGNISNRGSRSGLIRGKNSHTWDKSVFQFRCSRTFAESLRRLSGTRGREGPQDVPQSRYHITSVLDLHKQVAGWIAGLALGAWPFLDRRRFL